MRQDLRTCAQAARPEASELPPLPADASARSAVWVERTFWMERWLGAKAVAEINCALKAEAVALIDANNAIAAGR